MENKIDGVTNLACDIMKVSNLPIELSGAIATELYNKGYRKVEEEQVKWQLEREYIEFLKTNLIRAKQDVA